VRTRKVKRSSQSLWLLWAHTPDGAVWLSKRPTPGVWAGLHCLPLFDSEDALLAAVPRALRKLLAPQPAFIHVLTHKDLHLHAWQLALPGPSLAWGDGRWVDAQDWPKLGLPAPIRKMLGSP
jgi:A/G-specific adenine glycosylase